MTADSNDRWFRMCKDADKYLASHSHWWFDKNGNGICFNSSHSDKRYNNWTVDELIEMRQWKDGPTRKPIMITMWDDNRWEIRDMTTNLRPSFHGESLRDCTLQLIMWDRHGMTWDDEQGRWIK